MTNSHVVSTLRQKRAEISGHIHDLEKRIARQRADLANLDAAIKLFFPGTNPDAIPPKRGYRRARHVAHNELSRLTLMQAKGMQLNEIVADRLFTVLRRLRKQGTSRDAQWALVHRFADVSVCGCECISTQRRCKIDR